MGIFNKKKKNIVKDNNFENKNSLLVNFDENVSNSQQLELTNGNKNLQKNNFDDNVQFKSSWFLKTFNIKSYNDVQTVANILLENGEIVVNLELLTKEERIRILDFLSGIIYSFKGNVQKLKIKTYHFIIK